MLEAVPLEELTSTAAIMGENDAEATKLLREADAMTYGKDDSSQQAKYKKKKQRSYLALFSTYTLQGKRGRRCDNGETKEGHDPKHGLVAGG